MKVTIDETVRTAVDRKISRNAEVGEIEFLTNLISATRQALGPEFQKSIELLHGTILDHPVVGPTYRIKVVIHYMLVSEHKKYHVGLEGRVLNPATPDLDAEFLSKVVEGHIRKIRHEISIRLWGFKSDLASLEKLYESIPK